MVGNVRKLPSCFCFEAFSVFIGVGSSVSKLVCIERPILWKLNDTILGIFLNNFGNNGFLAIVLLFIIVLLTSWLNSTCKCNRILINNLFKFFVWREVSKSFTRSIIEFIFNPLNLFVGYFTKVLTLWDILPDKPVGVFIGTTFP